MKNEKGSVSVKAIIIAVIAILVVGAIVIFALSKAGVLKGGNKEDSEKNASKNSGKTETMSYIGKDGDDYVFIDTNGNVRKISQKTLGYIDMNEGSMVYQNCIMASEDGKQSLVDFSGKTIYGPTYMRKIIASEDVVLYQFSENSNYGVINAKGEIVVPAEYDEYMSDLGNGIEDYFYTHSYNYNGSGYIITIFDKDGKKVYEGESRDSSLYGCKGVVTRKGVNIIAYRKDDNTVLVLNLNTGDIIQTINATNEYTINLSTNGSSLEVEYYKGSMYGDEAENKKIYYWFDENNKVSKTIELAENESFNYWNGSAEEAFSILHKATGEYVAINEYGKEVYTSTYALSQKQYASKTDGKITGFLIEDLGKKQYKTYNAEGKVVLEGNVSYVGNKYILSGTTLYKHDGTKYMDDIKGYASTYNLDVIKTNDKVIIENENNNKFEKDADYKLGDKVYLLDDNTIVVQSDKKLLIINTEDLSTKEFDYSSASYVFIRNGYYYISNNNNYEYYNKNGDKIYTKNK